MQQTIVALFDFVNLILDRRAGRLNVSCFVAENSTAKTDEQHFIVKVENFIVLILKQSANLFSIIHY